MIETVIALLLIVDHEIKEHRIQHKCIKSKAEIEFNIDGSKTIKKLILE